MNKMKRHLSLGLSVFLTAAAVFTGCGKAEPNPNSGVYEATDASAYGMTMSVNDIYPGGITLELKDGGKAKMTLDGDDYGMKWTLEGDSFHAKGGGAELDGTLSDGTLLIDDLMGSGVSLTFYCDAVANGPKERDRSGSVLDHLKKAASE